jgi:hypothetical protein
MYHGGAIRWRKTNMLGWRPDYSDQLCAGGCRIGRANRRLPAPIGRCIMTPSSPGASHPAHAQLVRLKHSTTFCRQREGRVMNEGGPQCRSTTSSTWTSGSHRQRARLPREGSRIHAMEAADRVSSRAMRAVPARAAQDAAIRAPRARAPVAAPASAGRPTPAGRATPATTRALGRASAEFVCCPRAALRKACSTLWSPPARFLARSERSRQRDAS